MKDIERRKQQRCCRPIVSVSTAPKEWWKYAIRCHIGKDALKPKLSWKDILQKGKENILYVENYTKLLGI